MKKFACLLAALIVGGCAARQLPELSVSEEATAQVGIVNHTGNFIYSGSVNGAGGSNMSAWGAGLANMCCTSIPRAWYPGMNVVVRWDMPEGHQHIHKQKIVEVEKYDKPGSIYLHFFPNDEVRVIVTSIPGFSTHHPIPPSKKPESPTTPN